MFPPLHIRGSNRNGRLRSTLRDQGGVILRGSQRRTRAGRGAARLSRRPPRMKLLNQSARRETRCDRAAMLVWFGAEYAYKPAVRQISHALVAVEFCSRDSGRHGPRPNVRRLRRELTTASWTVRPRNIESPFLRAQRRKSICCLGSDIARRAGTAGHFDAPVGCLRRGGRDRCRRYAIQRPVGERTRAIGSADCTAPKGAASCRDVHRPE